MGFFCLEQKHDGVKGKIDDLTKQVDALRNEVQTLKGELKEARADNNNLEQHGRRWAVRIYGLDAPADSVKENAKQLASDFFQHNVDLVIPVNEIDCAHRVGGKTNGKQALLVRFHRRDYVDALVEVRKKLKGTGFVIFEDATYRNRQLINRLKSHSAIDSSWLSRGKDETRSIATTKRL